MVLLLDKKIDFFLSQIIKRVRCWCTAAKGTEKKKKEAKLAILPSKHIVNVGL